MFCNAIHSHYQAFACLAEHHKLFNVRPTFRQLLPSEEIRFAADLDFKNTANTDGYRSHVTAP